MDVIENVNQAVLEHKDAPVEAKAAVVSDDSGNTSRKRGFLFTLNNYTDAEVATIKQFFMEKCNWGIFGFEVGEQGTPHLQGAFQRKNPITIKGLKKDIGNRCHIQIMNGTYEQNKAYCSKGGNVHEFGKCPAQGTRNDIAVVKELVQDGKGMADIVDGVSSYQAMRCGELMLKYMEKGRDFKPLVMWFFGSTGTGKTFYAWEIAKRYGYRTWCSAKNLQWFEGYDAHEAVIIDDFRRDFCSYAELLLLLDRYPYRVMNKGGSRQMMAKLMIITCPKDPNEMFCVAGGGYNAENDIGQLLRRIDYVVNIRGLDTVWPWV